MKILLYTFNACTDFAHSWYADIPEAYIPDLGLYLDEHNAWFENDPENKKFDNKQRRPEVKEVELTAEQELMFRELAESLGLLKVTQKAATEWLDGMFFKEWHDAAKARRDAEISSWQTTTSAVLEDTPPLYKRVLRRVKCLCCGGKGSVDIDTTEDVAKRLESSEE